MPPHGPPGSSGAAQGIRGVGVCGVEVAPHRLLLPLALEPAQPPSKPPISLPLPTQTVISL